MAVVMVRTNTSRLTLRAGGQVPVADLHAPDPGPPHRLPRGPFLLTISTSPPSEKPSQKKPVGAFALP